MRNYVALTDLPINMGPPMSHYPQETKALFKSCLRLFAKYLISDEAVLKVYSSDNNHTMPQCWIRHFEVFHLDEFEKMYNPVRMKGKLFEGVANK